MPCRMRMLLLSCTAHNSLYAMHAGGAFRSLEARVRHFTVLCSKSMPMCLCQMVCGMRHAVSCHALTNARIALSSIGRQTAEGARDERSDASCAIAA